MYMASYEEDAPNLVDNWIPKPTIKQQRGDTGNTEENKTTTDTRNLIGIRDKEDELESDWILYVFIMFRQ